MTRDPSLFFRTAAAGALTAVETTPAIRVLETPIEGLAINVRVPHENAEDTLDIVWFESEDGSSYKEGGRLPQIVSNWSVGSIVPRFYRTRVASRGHYVRLELRPAGTSPDYGAVETWLGPYDPVQNLTLNEAAKPLFPPEISTEGLVAYWPLAEASGARNDFQGANHLAQNGTVGRRRGPGGAIPYAADFDGSGANRLSIADNPALSMGDIPFEITGWARFGNLSARHIVITKFSLPAAGQFREWGIWTDLETPNVLTMQVSSDGTTSVEATSSTVLTPNTWVFFDAWHDPVVNTINISVNNGAPASTPHAGGIFDGTNPVTVGAFNDGSSPMVGQIAGVTFWKRLLTPAEKDALMNMQLQPEFNPNGALHLM